MSRSHFSFRSQDLKQLFTGLRAVMCLRFHIFGLIFIYADQRDHFSLCVCCVFASVHVCLQQTALCLCESGTEVSLLLSVSLNTTGSLLSFFISAAPHVLHCISLSVCDTRASVSASLGRSGFLC